MKRNEMPTMKYLYRVAYLPDSEDLQKYLDQNGPQGLSYPCKDNCGPDEQEPRIESKILQIIADDMDEAIANFNSFCEEGDLEAAVLSFAVEGRVLSC